MFPQASLSGFHQIRRLSLSFFLTPLWSCLNLTQDANPHLAVWQWLTLNTCVQSCARLRKSDSLHSMTTQRCFCDYDYDFCAWTDNDARRLFATKSICKMKFQNNLKNEFCCCIFFPHRHPAMIIENFALNVLFSAVIGEHKAGAGNYFLTFIWPLNIFSLKGTIPLRGAN